MPKTQRKLQGRYLEVKPIVDEFKRQQRLEGLTYREVATRSGKDIDHVRIMLKRRRIVHMSNALALAKALHLDPVDIGA